MDDAWFRMLFAGGGGRAVQKIRKDSGRMLLEIQHFTARQLSGIRRCRDAKIAMRFDMVKRLCLCWSIMLI